MTSAVVVGSGPNGLAAALTLARAGVNVTVIEANDELGGGIRNAPSMRKGLIQDHCAAFHPMAAGSPFLGGLNLDQMGVHWMRAPIDCAHPLDGGDVVELHQSLDDTAAGLGSIDGARWRVAFDFIVEHFDQLSLDIMGPMVTFPKHPALLAGFGLTAMQSARGFARRFRDDRTRALFMGVAAHAFQPLTSSFSAAIGVSIIAAGHAYGWPVIEGGTGRLADALVAEIRALGGTFQTGRRVESLDELPPHDILMLDTDPGQAADILGAHMPKRVQRSYREFRRGPAAFVVDFAVDGGVPWENPLAGLAGTVHLGGSAEEIIRAEAQVARGQMPERPFVLLGQQFVADPSRSAGNLKPVYAYAHVPFDFAGDATEAILGQIERFAPGFRARVREMRVRTPADIAADNANFVGGDILTGAKSATQFTLGPRTTAHPYDTGVRGAYICSASTPPGPGAHGMAGANAATRALGKLGMRANGMLGGKE